MGCEIVENLLQFLIRILKKAGWLENGNRMSLFVFADYNFNPIENISLVTL